MSKSSELDSQQRKGLAAAGQELSGKEPLALFVVSAMEVLQASHFSGDLAVQLKAGGYGGVAYLTSGEKLEFTTRPSRPRTDDLYDDIWQRHGFSDAEIESGISVLLGRYDYHDKRIKNRHILVSGLFDDSDIRVLRRQQDGCFADSSLSAEEKATMLRIAFLSQLVGYVSDRYAEKGTYEVTDEFIAELLKSSDAFDENLLKSMFYGWSLPGSRQMHNLSRTLVCGITRFDDLIDNYRTDKSGRVRFGNGGPERDLVKSGEYFERIVESLGGLQHQAGEQVTPVLEATQRSLDEAE